MDIQSFTSLSQDNLETLQSALLEEKPDLAEIDRLFDASGLKALCAVNDLQRFEKGCLGGIACALAFYQRVLEDRRAWFIFMSDNTTFGNWRVEIMHESDISVEDHGTNLARTILATVIGAIVLVLEVPERFES